MRKTPILAIITMMLAGLAVSVQTAAPSRAEPQSALGQAIIAARATSACAPLQSDPLVERTAAMANQSSSDYMSFRSAAVPFTDPLPALSTIGYHAAKALQLTGYGATRAEALHGLMLQWQAAPPDCSYTQFGTSTWHDDSGFELASAILTTPA
ncbi:hypothetical protein B1790_05765 [Mycobacterium sp. AT1]|nr:hypothetical protein B1790_05765 [Mycobacterium sp. AT1]